MSGAGGPCSRPPAAPPLRSVLDFDFEKLCSISLSHINVYACLVCGKYFQGESRAPPPTPLWFLGGGPSPDASCRPQAGA